MDSDDSVWEPVSEGSSAESSTEEVQDGLSDEVSLDEIAEDRSINLCGEDVHDKVVGLILRDKCNDRFLQGKAAELEDFLRSTSNMTAQEKSRAACLQRGMMCSLRRFHGNYHSLPPSDSTWHLFRQGTQELPNMNATKIKIRWLVSWFRSFASTLGDVVPVRVRTQKTIDGNLYTEMNAYVLENDLDVRNPRPSTFRKLLQQYCPTIRIRSPRSNVCDLYAILHTCMRSCVTAELTEELGVHTEAAKEMSLEYKKDLASVSEDHAVIVMDFSQNLTLPSVAIQLLESVAGKGTDEVNSMLYHFIQRIVLANDHRKLTIYADNSQTGELDVVELKFFVKGHTKNAVDRGFSLMRKKFAKEDVWTADQLLEVINDSLSSSALVHIPKENTTMKLFRTPVTEVYKDLKGVQRYQIFTMSEKKPGVVSCRVGPPNQPMD
ncbi:hypothetical protein L917_07066 [Phytophthora nicotianae]|uniref:DUF7869 domain-containing protein n=1 Tax=Phytophthora nicotianae TaxID=4792 RepID=W2LCG6_PHYNI|nr:hypothetical protein L917_07066 [Phytophthora nicotianae]